MPPSESLSSKAGTGRREQAARGGALTVLLALSLTVSAQTIAPPTFNSEIETITERTQLAPEESLRRLKKLQLENPDLALHDAALLYSQFNRALFYAKDYPGALRYGQFLEKLGKTNDSPAIVGSGLLAQAYPNWRLGNIETAYGLTQAANRIPAAALGPKVRIEALLAVAQLDVDERRPQSALLKIEEAYRLAEKDETLQYMVNTVQARILPAADDNPNALVATERLLLLATNSPYVERMIRARGVEFTVALAAGEPGRADHAISERVRLLRKLNLSESLGTTLLEYAEFKLNSHDYPAALALSQEAASLPTVKKDPLLQARAHFSRALSRIYLGAVLSGKTEIEHMLAAPEIRPALLTVLPQYAAALMRAGEVDAALKAERLRQKLESEIALARAKETEKSKSKLEDLSRETVSAHGQRNIWLAIALLLVTGLGALVWRHIRLRAGSRILADANRQSEVALEEAAARQTILRQQALEAQIRILQAQIEPHFLFNTLANLRYLYRTSLIDGEEMLNHLIGYLRSAMDELRSDCSTIERELQMTRHYLSIMGMRMGDKLQYNISCAREVLATAFPSAMLLTLVENAIKHGLQNRLDGRIDVVVTCDDECIWLTVVDNGVGVSTVSGTGIGLENIRQRLAAAYGERASLQTGPLPDGGFAATIMLPHELLEPPLCQPQ